MRCATPTTIYAFTSTGNTRGTYAGLTVGAEVSVCPTGTYVVMTPVEYDNYTTSPFQLSLSEAGAISGAVLTLWALGFCIRMMVRAMRADQATGEIE